MPPEKQLSFIYLFFVYAVDGYVLSVKKQEVEPGSSLLPVKKPFSSKSFFTTPNHQFNMAKRTLAAATAVVLFASMPQSATVVSAQQMAISPSLPTTVLESGNAFPLVGLEMDGLATDELGHRISDAMQNTTQYGFFDISQRNQNERRLNAGIVNAVRSSNLYASEIHVITKVPYTHLGYERTKLSVKNALMELKNRNTHVHVQLEWPRCDDSISWMNCEQDEARLPAHVKAVGPPPHHSPETAFLESWRALEDIYLQEIRLGRDLPVVESIGVANFEVSDLQDLEMVSRVQPHILQVRSIFVIVIVISGFDNIETPSQLHRTLTLPQHLRHRRKMYGPSSTIPSCWTTANYMGSTFKSSMLFPKSLVRVFLPPVPSGLFTW